MTLLVTGCAGFIGSNFVQYYLRKHPEETIIGISRLTHAGDLNNIILTEDEKERFRFYNWDICDADKINQLFKEGITGIINFAAQTHVDTSIDSPGSFLTTNICGVFNLINCIRQNNVSADFRFVQISTDEVYGPTPAGKQFSEKSPLHPKNPYSATKAAGELLIQSFVNTYNLPAIIVRCANNYGPNQHPEKLIPKIITRALKHEKIPVYGDGKQVRDWIYVQDNCEALDIVLEKGKIGEVYNISANEEWQNINIIYRILSILKNKTGDELINEELIEYVPDRLGHDFRYALDASKIREQLGWRPRTTIHDGLNTTIDSYLKKCGKVVL